MRTAAARRTAVALTVEQVQALPAVVDLVTAAHAFGIGRTKAFDLLKAGQFPVAVLTLGRAYRCKKSDICRELGIPLTGRTEHLPR